jgi:hypothetical protein
MLLCQNMLLNEKGKGTEKHRSAERKQRKNYQRSTQVQVQERKPRRQQARRRVRLHVWLMLLHGGHFERPGVLARGVECGVEECGAAGLRTLPPRPSPPKPSHPPKIVYQQHDAADLGRLG